MTKEPAFFPTEADFRRWLEANHETAPELLVGFSKKGGEPPIDTPQASKNFSGGICDVSRLYRRLHAGRRSLQEN